MDIHEKKLFSSNFQTTATGSHNCFVLPTDAIKNWHSVEVPSEKKYYKLCDYDEE